MNYEKLLLGCCFVAALAFAFAGCSPEMRAKICAFVGRAVVKCGPELIREIGEILLRPDWQKGIGDKVAEVGFDLVKCAVDANASPSGDSHPSDLVYRTAKEDRAKLAQQWMIQNSSQLRRVIKKAKTPTRSTTE
jgi:hypothetical protein